VIYPNDIVICCQIVCCRAWETQLGTALLYLYIARLHFNNFLRKVAAAAAFPPLFFHVSFPQRRRLQIIDSQREWKMIGLVNKKAPTFMGLALKASAQILTPAFCVTARG
jgi:hypothetical protein